MPRTSLAAFWVLLVLLAATPSFAASSINPTPVAGTGMADKFNVSQTTGNADTTGANFLRIGIVTYFSQTGHPGPTDSKGNTYTQLGSEVGQSGAYITYWYCANPTVGTGHNFTYNPGTTMYGVLTAIAYSGVSTSSPVEATYASNTTASSGSISAGSLTPANNGDLLELIAATSGVGGTPYSATGGFTLTDQVDGVAANNIGKGSFNLLQGAATAVNPAVSYTGSNPPATVMLVAIKPATYTPPVGGSSNSLLMHSIP